MNGISIKTFSNSDLRLLMEEKCFIISALKVGEKEIEQMINNEEEIEEMKNEMKQLKKEIKEYKNIIKVFKKEITTKIDEIKINEIEKDKKIIEEMKRNKEKEEYERKVKDEEISQINEQIKKKEVMEEQFMKNLEIVKEKIDKIDKLEKHKQINELIDKFNQLPYSDRKGIINFIKENDKILGNIKIIGKPCSSSYQQILPRIIERNYAGHCWQSENNDGSFIEVEFQNDIEVLVEKYFFHSHDEEIFNKYHLRNWRIEGRKKNGEWIIIDEKNNNCELRDDHRENIFENSRKQTEGISSIRLIITGKNSKNSSHEMCIRNIDFFGKIINK